MFCYMWKKCCKLSIIQCVFTHQKLSSAVESHSNILLFPLVLLLIFVLFHGVDVWGGDKGHLGSVSMTTGVTKTVA